MYMVSVLKSITVGMPEIAGTPESLSIWLENQGIRRKGEYILRQQGVQEKKCAVRRRQARNGG